MINFLLENGADINKLDGYGNSLLFSAIKNNNIKLIKFLLKKNANINFQNKYTTPLMLAIKMKNIELVKILLKNGANINFQDKNLNTPLILAIKMKNIELVKILLKNNADITPTGI